MSLLLLLVHFLLSVWRSEAQSISINSALHPNNTNVFFTDVGEGANAVSCHSMQPGCCKNPNVGEWYYPNGDVVPNSLSAQDFYRNRDQFGNVFLHRRNSIQTPSGVYYCKIPDSQGMLTTLGLGIYKPEDYPTITQSPLTQLGIPPGTDVLFSVESTHSTRYHWYRGQSALSDLASKYRGIRSSTLTILDVRREDQGIYSCLVSSLFFSVASSGAFLVTLEAPSLLSEARDAVGIALGSDVTFLVIAKGPNLLYTWELGNGSSLPTLDPRFTGVSTSRLIISNIRLSDEGEYTCVVSNAAGSVRSTASLTISNPYLIESMTVIPFITSAQVMWTPSISIDINSNFDLQYYPTSFPSLLVSLNTNYTSVLVGGLLPQLHYHFQVQLAGVDLPMWTMADVQLEENIPPVDNFSAEIIGSFIHLSWVPSELLGWTIGYYYITYSAYLPSKTRHEFTQRFVVEGNLISKTISEAKLFLRPQVSHIFEIRACLDINDLEGIGEVRGDTATARISLDYETLPFQVMIGPIDNCIHWGKSKADMISSFLRESIVHAVTSRCNCSFTDEDLGSGFFSCRISQSTAIYRSTVVWLNSTNLIGHIQDWVLSSETVLLEWFIVDVMDSCPTGISSLHDEDCVIPESELD